jgi:hypothetical protein
LTGQQPNLEDYDVLAEGEVVSRIFLSPGAPAGAPLDEDERPQGRHTYRAAHGYEPTREAAMAAFAKRRRRDTKTH